MSTKNWQIDLLLMMGFGAGFYSFLKGFRIYREYRILEDTPEVPIRGVAMGLIHVRGQTLAEETLTSPVACTPCVFYRVDIESGRETGTGAGGGTTPPILAERAFTSRIPPVKYWSTRMAPSTASSGGNSA